MNIGSLWSDNWWRQEYPNPQNDTEAMKKMKMSKLLQHNLINIFDYLEILGMTPQYVSDVYNVIYNFERIIKYKRHINLDDRQIEEIKNLPLVLKMRSMKEIIEEDIKIQKLRSHKNAYFINNYDYQKLALMTPFEVSNILIKIQYLRWILKDWFIDNDEFDRINKLPLEQKIEEISSLKEEIQAKRIFLVNAERISQEYTEQLISFLDPQSLDAHSHNLSLVNSLLKNRSFYISEEIYLYLKNLEPNELADKIGFLNIVINSIDKTISSIQSEEERAYYLENSEKYNLLWKFG